ncbi:Gfo/Idh/MocA family protein [Paenibacillus nasutitermitis]|uniref:Inositol 2-dehydrogenase n=1 Tax=Paenibacillus nasutitermitis TaxID=1652958 RepID=A0A917DMT8_9BACL|nr:Gfo/Idh/MocA family oxidoreductase [Paenibacillus nasutitermitis]GGD51833.1 inositol 2-dehydrogenase [Paenibacillus nasutitermitis]
MKEIKLGIVGLGRFAQLHLQCYRQIPGVSVAAVCDVRAEAAQETAQQFGSKAYTDPLEMLRNEQLDALIVLTPEPLHYDAVMAGIDAGLAVFVEKPLATDLADAERMVTAAAQRNTLLVVGHATRFDPRNLQLKQAIDAGKIGRIRSIYARRSDGRQFFHIYKRTPAIYTLGIHDIDQILWYMRELPIEVYAKSSSSDVGEDMVLAMLTFQNGVVAVIDSNWMTPNAWPAGQDQTTHIMGDSGQLSMGHPDSAFVMSTEDRHEIPSLYTLNNIHGKLQGSLYSELEHFIDCVRDGRSSSPILPAQDALRVVKVADAIVRSYTEQKPVLLEPEQL